MSSLFLFFFSSRRRHTRFDCDWSSDVCSSDLSEVMLTHTEFDLLTFLASNAGKVLSREKILNSIWGYEYPIETRVIDVHIRNLRRKIETQPSRPYYILAVPGIGYRFTNARPA